MLKSIYETRQAMNTDSNLLLEKAEYVDITAFGLSGLIDFKGELLRQRVKNGMKMRILIPVQDSVFVKQREKDEGCIEGSITDSIVKLIKWVKDTNDQNKDYEDAKPIMLKEYDALPMESYMRIDDTIFIGPFMIGRKSQLTMSYKYIKGKRGFTYFGSYFDNIWNNKIITKDAVS